VRLPASAAVRAAPAAARLPLAQLGAPGLTAPGRIGPGQPGWLAADLAADTGPQQKLAGGRKLARGRKMTATGIGAAGPGLPPSVGTLSVPAAGQPGQ
jgi:hypothetical protein